MSIGMKSADQIHYALNNQSSFSVDYGLYLPKSFFAITLLLMLLSIDEMDDMRKEI